MASQSIDVKSATTISEIKKGDSQTVIWELKDWKDCHKFLATQCSCICEIGDANLRFFLRPETNTFQTKNDCVTTINFYSLWVEVLSDQKNLLLRLKGICSGMEIRVQDKRYVYEGCSVLIDSQLVLNRLTKNCDGKLLVKEDFISMGSTRKYIERDQFSWHESPWQKAPEVHISITVTLYKFPAGRGVIKSIANENSGSLVDHMSSLLVENAATSNFYDVELKMEDDVSLSAHRAILSARSSVFRAMFSSGMKESSSVVVPIKDIGSKAMKIILMYIYTDIIDKEWAEYVEDVVQAASMYDLPQLLNYCDENMIKICNVYNAVELFKLAKLYSLETAIKQFTEFTQSHTADVLLNS